MRAAIERLAMAPVMFELGARPHPPRELYRAYLEQSDIFVGVYWEEYGWVAPGEDVSGLEDEWVLAPDIPKLVYLKRSEHRQERLEALLARIREDDDASYVVFSDAAGARRPRHRRPRERAGRAVRRRRPAPRVRVRAGVGVGAGADAGAAACDHGEDDGRTAVAAHPLARP